VRRRDGRDADELRKVVIERNFLKYAQGSALISMGNTRVICSALVEKGVPPFRRGSGGGWLTAEYSMLPYSTPTRIYRDLNQQGGRSYEIQRLIGRALRGVIDLERLGEWTIWIDCDVIQADGGTRCASITGAFVALVDVDKWLQEKRITRSSIIKDSLAAVSVGINQGEKLLDLSFYEDSQASVDMNVAATGRGRFVEIQISGEGGSFSREVFEQLLVLSEKGIKKLIEIQKEVIGESMWKW